MPTRTAVSGTFRFRGTLFAPVLLLLSLSAPAQLVSITAGLAHTPQVDLAYEI